MALEKRWRSQSPEYRAYMDAKSRCINPNKKNYHRYGGRGIEFRFESFDEFFVCIGFRPEGKSLDRINNDGHYEKGNIRWATLVEQNANRHKKAKHKWREAVEKAKHFLVVCPNGEQVKIFNMAKFCREHGLSKSNLHMTMKTNWTHFGYKAIAH